MNQDKLTASYIHGETAGVSTAIPDISSGHLAKEFRKCLLMLDLLVQTETVRLAGTDVLIATTTVSILRIVRRTSLLPYK
jgi:hypothetical protein